MKNIIRILSLVLISLAGTTQEDLLSLLEEEPIIEYAIAGFKTNRVINLHSFENTPKKVLDFKINHRFGNLNSGIDELFGLDQSSTRIAFDYGISDVWQIGFGRSSVDKVIDTYSKYTFIRQSSGLKNMPVSTAFILGMGIKSNRFLDDTKAYSFSHRISYHAQLLIGRKFSDNFSLEIVPTFIHRNLTKTKAEKNDVWALGVGFRQKITKRLAVTGEYIYVFPGQLAKEFTHSISIGFDIETGGHVFQLHFTNSTLSHEAGFITETRGNILKGDIRFGFNISRVFSL